MVNIKLTHNFSTLILLLRPHREVRLLKWRDFNKELTYVSVDGSRVKSKRNRIMPIPEFIRKGLVVSDSDDNIFSLYLI